MGAVGGGVGVGVGGIHIQTNTHSNLIFREYII